MRKLFASRSSLVPQNICDATRTRITKPRPMAKNQNIPLMALIIYEN